jgi:hypothetical protein
MGVKILLRNDISTIWTSVNPILGQGEIGIESDTRKLKIGDGILTWNLLNYYQFGVSTGYVLSGGYIGTAQDLKDEIDAISSGIGVQLQIHLDDLNNPHQVTKAQVGLNEVDNTSDANKPISIVTQSALNSKVDKIVGKCLSTNDLSNTLLGSISQLIIDTHTHSNKTLLDSLISSGSGSGFLSNNGTYINLNSLDGGNASTIF